MREKYLTLYSATLNKKSSEISVTKFLLSLLLWVVEWCRKNTSHAITENNRIVSQGTTLIVYNFSNRWQQQKRARKVT